MVMYVAKSHLPKNIATLQYIKVAIYTLNQD